METLVLEALRQIKNTGPKHTNHTISANVYLILAAKLEPANDISRLARLDKDIEQVLGPLINAWPDALKEPDFKDPEDWRYPVAGIKEVSLGLKNIWKKPRRWQLLDWMIAQLAGEAVNDACTQIQKPKEIRIWNAAKTLRGTITRKDCKTADIQWDDGVFGKNIPLKVVNQLAEVN